MHSLRSRPVAPRPLQVFSTLVSLLRLHGVDARLPPYPDPRGAAVDPSALKPQPNMEWVDRCVKYTQLSAAECLREADASARRGGYVAVMKVFDYHLTEPGSSRTSAWAALADLRPVVLLSDRCDVLDRLICEERRADARSAPSHSPHLLHSLRQVRNCFIREKRQHSVDSTGHPSDACMAIRTNSSARATTLARLDEGACLLSPPRSSATPCR